MRIGIPAETRPGETRVAATPETVKKLAAKHAVVVQAGAGVNASIIDEAYLAAGATLGSAADALGADLARAVAASCSVPGAWPPVLIDGIPYMDGGMRSASNADLATGYDKVLVLSCAPEAPDSPFGPTLPQVLRGLSEGAETFLIEADEASLSAFGTNVLLSSTRRPSVLAGQEQGAAVVDAVKVFWGV